VQTVLKVDMTEVKPKYLSLLLLLLARLFAIGDHFTITQVGHCFTCINSISILRISLATQTLPAWTLAWHK